jgi:hypothetical protein
MKQIYQKEKNIMNEQIFNLYLKKDETNKDPVTFTPKFYHVITYNANFGILKEDDMSTIHYIIINKHREFVKTFRISNYQKRNGELVYSGFTIYTEELKLVFKAELIF